MTIIAIESANYTGFHSASHIWCTYIYTLVRKQTLQPFEYMWLLIFCETNPCIPGAAGPYVYTINLNNQILYLKDVFTIMHCETKISQIE